VWLPESSSNFGGGAVAHAVARALVTGAEGSKIKAASVGDFFKTSLCSLGMGTELSSKLEVVKAVRTGSGTLPQLHPNCHCRLAL